MEEAPVVSIEHLRIVFPGMPEHVAVEDISFSLAAGKTLAIVGESGSGKSLIALALMGLLPNKARWTGTITLRKEDRQYIMQGPQKSAAWIPLRGNVATLLFQDPTSVLNPVMQIGKQLEEAISAKRSAGGASAKHMAIEWLGKVQLPDPANIYHRYPHELTAGQKQRLMIAMAMSTHPSLLIADEPTATLDLTTQREILILMHQLRQEFGTAIIFITHHLALAAQLADEVLVLLNGKVIEYGPASIVLKTPSQAYTKALLHSRPVPLSKGFRLPIIADALALQEEPRTDIPLPEIKITKDPLLQVKNLRVWFPAETNVFGTATRFHRAVEDVTFTMQTGEVLALVGETGSGKSTLCRALMGLQPLESGKIIFDGRDLVHLGPSGWRNIRRQIQMIFHDPNTSLNPHFTIGEAIREPLRAHGIVPRKEAASEASRLVSLVHLPDTALNHYPHQFSGADRLRIVIARALALRPRLLIFDESLSSLDNSTQAELLNLLKDLQAQLHLSYLFISHDLPAVHYLADRVMVMRTGKIIEAGTAEAVLRHPQQEYTRTLVAAIP